MSEAALTKEITARLGRSLTLTLAVDTHGRVVAIRDVAPPAEDADGHGLKVQRHAVASVARLMATVDRGPHDTPALLAQAWAFAALQAANVLRRVEEQEMRALAVAEHDAVERAKEEAECPTK